MSGRDGWDALSKHVENEKDEVVVKVKGNGIVQAV